MQPEDIELPDISDEQMAALIEPEGMVRVLCDHCDAPQVIEDTKLDTQVACEGCKEEFNASWGSPVIDLKVPTKDTEPTA